MAYAYNTIDNLLNGAQPNGNVNIFNQSPEQVGNLGQGMQPGGATGNGSPMNPMGVKSDASGDLSNVMASSRSGGGGQAPGSFDSQRSTMDAMRANTGKVNAPKKLDSLGQDIHASNLTLGNQAAKYIQDQSLKNTNMMSNADLDKASMGDSQYYGATKDLLSKSAPGSAEAFDPTNLKAVRNGDLLKNNAGIGEMMRMDYGPKYSKGMGAFDSMLLGRDQNFLDTLNSTKSGYKNLVNETEKQRQALPGQALKDQIDTLKAAQDGAKGYLTGINSNIDTAAMAQAKAAEDKVNAIKNDPNQMGVLQGKALKEQEAAVRKRLEAIYGVGRADPQIADAMKSIDPSKYINFASYTPDQFIGEAGAKQYNTINQLLGLGGPVRTAGTPAANPYTIDQQGLYNALYDPASTARYKKDVDLQSQIDAILAGAGTAANQAKTSAKSQIGSILDILNKQGEGLRSKASTLPNYNTNPFRVNGDPNAISSFNQQYLKNNPINKRAGDNLSAQDFINAKQSKQLNSLLKELGSNKTYSSGQYAEGYNPGIYDAKSYENALLAAMSAAAGTTMTNNNSNFTGKINDPRAITGGPNQVYIDPTPAIGVRNEATPRSPMDLMGNTLALPQANYQGGGGGGTVMAGENRYPGFEDIAGMGALGSLARGFGSIFN